MRYLAIGDPLVEFTSRRDASSTFDRRAGGDTLNTAIYLSRLSAPGSVGYLSCVGNDLHSIWLRQAIAAEGVDVSTLAINEQARASLSFISTDANGERSFSYWRDQSPFRTYFNEPANLAELEKAPVLIFSAIILAVLKPQGRAHFLKKLAALKQQGKQIIFDTNYRAVLWEDVATARAFITKAARIATVLLPSLDDIEACFGIGSPIEAMQKLISMSDAEIVLTTGGGHVVYRAEASEEIEQFELPKAVTAIDTTGAGDSFNAGFLAARNVGMAAQSAILQAAKLASIVVQHPGAIIPLSSMPATSP